MISIDLIYQRLQCFFFLSQRLRPTIHEIITSQIKAYAEQKNSSRLGFGQAVRSETAAHFMKGQSESLHVPKQKGRNGIPLAGTLVAVSPVSPVMAPMGKAQTSARDLLDSVLEAVVRIFGQNFSFFISFYFSFP